MKWIDFVKLCGYEPFTKIGILLKDLIEKYKLIVQEYGTISYSANWMQKNKIYCWVYYNATRKFNLSWEQFLMLCEGNQIDFGSEF